MQQLMNFGDCRQEGHCVYCGNMTESRDHVPSKVLLDEPYPENLPVVFSCLQCNQGFFLDEEYFACLIACLIAGSTIPENISRSKIQRILARKPSLTAMLENARQVHGDSIFFNIDKKRVDNVILKLARGHAMFELNEPQLEQPIIFNYLPISSLTNESRDNFERVPNASLIPEVGSRAMQNLLILGDKAMQEWITAQPRQYRYIAFDNGATTVRIVISEFLACEVIWRF